MYGLSLAPEHMRPLSAEISNIIYESAQKILDATGDTICTKMDRAQKQGERHFAHTNQDYKDYDNPDYLISECRLLGIVGHYHIREKGYTGKIYI